jgi:hypothetical protein
MDDTEYYSLREMEILSHAQSVGLDEELISYANQIRRQLGSDGDTCDWIDALEMAYSELITHKYF